MDILINCTVDSDVDIVAKLAIENQCKVMMVDGLSVHLRGEACYIEFIRFLMLFRILKVDHLARCLKKETLCKQKTNSVDLMTQLQAANNPPFPISFMEMQENQKFWKLYSNLKRPTDLTKEDLY